MSLTPEDARLIAEAVAALQNKPSDFELDAREHYDAHKRLDKLLDIFDQCESAIWKIAVGVFVAAGLVIAALYHSLKQ